MTYTYTIFNLLSTLWDDDDISWKKSAAYGSETSHYTYGILQKKNTNCFVHVYNTQDVPVNCVLVIILLRTYDLWVLLGIFLFAFSTAEITSFFLFSQYGIFPWIRIQSSFTVVILDNLCSFFSCEIRLFILFLCWSHNVNTDFL